MKGGSIQYIAFTGACVDHAVRIDRARFLFFLAVNFLFRCLFSFKSHFSGLSRQERTWSARIVEGSSVDDLSRRVGRNAGHGTLSERWTTAKERETRRQQLPSPTFSYSPARIPSPRPLTHERSHARDDLDARQRLSLDL